MLNHTLVLSFLLTLTSCLKQREEVLPEEGVKTYTTSNGNTYSKICIMKQCYCQKNIEEHSSVPIDCSYYSEVRRLYNKFNHIDDSVEP